MNLFKQATQQAESKGTFYGKIDAHAEALYFAGGGARPVDFDETNPDHAAKGPSIKIEYTLIPIDDQDITFTPSTNCLTFTEEFTKILWPSLKGLGMEDAGSISGMWAKVEQVPTGRTWKTKEGEVKDNTTFKFHAAYHTLKECQSAFHMDRGTVPADEPAMDIPMGDEPAKKPAKKKAVKKTAKVEPNAEAALQFLPTVVMQAQGDMGKLDELLASTPIIQDMNWTHESEEVVNLLSELVAA